MISIAYAIIWKNYQLTFHKFLMVEVYTETIYQLDDVFLTRIYVLRYKNTCNLKHFNIFKTIIPRTNRFELYFHAVQVNCVVFSRLFTVPQKQPLDAVRWGNCSRRVGRVAGKCLFGNSFFLWDCRLKLGTLLVVISGSWLEFGKSYNHGRSLYGSF